jgi:hypothetical protein
MAMTCPLCSAAITPLQRYYEAVRPSPAHPSTIPDRIMYRRLPQVIAQHAGTIRVLHALRLFAVAMAGEGEFDPFKD